MKKLNVFLVKSVALFVLAWGSNQSQAQLALTPGVDYTKPNFAYSPPMRKFVDSLPGLGPTATNNLGQYIPVASANTSAYPGSDYYEIALVQYREQMHSDLPPVVGSKTSPTATGGALLRGYVQEVNGVAVGDPHYLGPLIVAEAGRPVRIKFTNRLPTGAGGDLFIPTDTGYMGAGAGPDGQNAYAQNRATLHLHGGVNPWISDGTPHQWTVPAGENTPYKKGDSTQDVPDMPATPDGVLTFYWPNQQGSRLQFYHDHALGITRLNVYVGEAAGYLVQDPAGTGEWTLSLPAAQIPLVIQDKSFVPDLTTLTALDPNWNVSKWGGMGNLWFPHIYVPNQDPTDLSGANAYGRWDYGPWFWPPWPVPPGSSPAPVSGVPESFLDTPLVNGTAYPYVDVQPQAYRLRILNAANDRFWNLQMYQAEPLHVSVTAGGTNYSANTTVTIAAPGGGGVQALATPTIHDGVIMAITVTNVPTGYTNTAKPLVTITDTTGSNAVAVASALTEVAMVPALPNPAIPFPPVWLTTTPGMIPDILDQRPSGVPNPIMRGPAMIQIGTEGGLLPNPVLLPNTPVGYEQNKRNIIVLNVNEKTLFLGPAERADIIVDFTPFAGKTIILYNDSPAPVPAGDPRYDFYTGNLDYSATGGDNDQGGAPSTRAGFGPNTRTIMQFRVAGTDSGTPGPVDHYPTNLLTSLQTTLPAAFKATQPVPIVPQSAFDTAGYTYNGVIGGSAPDTYVRIQSNYVSFIPYQTTNRLTMPLLSKAIHELFDYYGRMNSILGVELPFTSAFIQTTIPYGYIDPVTEIFDDGETQIWKITHNGVDTHAIHFHLVNVQVINRVGWDGAIRPPDDNELGWKETVRMNPLEDCIVATRAIAPNLLPFGVPDSVRALDPTMPVNGPGSVMGFAGVDPTTGFPIAVSNIVANFGWEYVWHCHLLGHEENDMMRPLVVTNVTGYSSLPPTVTATLSPPANGLGWNNTNVTVTINAVGAAGGFGVASVSYSASGATTIANNTVPGDTASLVVSTEGTTTVTFYATDQAATPRSSTPQSVLVKLDMTRPNLTLGSVTPAPGPSGWNATVPVTISWTASDTRSGVPIPTNGTVTFAAAGSNQTQVVTVADNAGNTRSRTTAAVNIDTNAPTATATKIPAANASGWNRVNTTVRITAVDNTGGSGVASITSSATGAQPMPAATVTGGTNNIVISTEGVTIITYSATDRAGNASAPQTVTVSFDRTAPALVWGTATPLPNSFGWTNTAVSIPWTATDANSGIASPGASGTATFTTQGSNQTRVVTMVDNAGNSNAFTSASVNLDLTAPVVTAGVTPSSAARNNGARNPSVTVTVSGLVTDALSGVDTSTGAGTFSVLDSQGTIMPGGTFTVAADGTYSFTIRFPLANRSRGVRTYSITVKPKDKAGNLGSVVTTFTVL